MTIHCCQCHQPLEQYSCLSLTSLKFYFSLSAYLRAERPALGQSSGAMCYGCYQHLARNHALPAFARSHCQAPQATFWA